MGKFKDMMTELQSELPNNVAIFNDYDDTSDFDGQSLIENDTPDTSIAQPVKRQKPTQKAPKASRRKDSVQHVAQGNLIENMDLSDPADVAELGARYMTMNESMKRLAHEKARLEQLLERAIDGSEKLTTHVEQLQKEKDELDKELVHAKEKLSIATNSSGALFQKAALGILTWGGIGAVLIFASAFFYF
jgi:predicted RNase H-like nuclease (RuvC/YqgF family)